ncbi:hypothetical protein MtrunA17_Chr2g0282551 [Medicago truncatula]|uniref:Uncharacterized protein n=1 Tax=Medicago truncatula TaxID=3880 RepID=A0A396J1T6_MEDTR|nr:hypothetical protein MtrunA17_Chr2g0282551 [Medicago truncatula]
MVMDNSFVKSSVVVSGIPGNLLFWWLGCGNLLSSVELVLVDQNV